MEVKEKDQIVIVDKNENVRSEDYGFPFYRRGISYGIGTGVLMGAISLLISALFQPSNAGWDYLKYIIMGVVLWRLLSNYKTYLPEGKVFKDGMLLGLLTAFVAALTMAVLILIAALAGMDSLFLTRYGLEPGTLGNALVLSSWAALEGMVYGLILTFVSLQFLKDGKPAE